MTPTPVPTQWSKVPTEDSWERDILNRLAFANLNEQRRARRWGIFFKILVFLYFLPFIVLLFSNTEWGNVSNLLEDAKEEEEIDSDGKHTALVELEGLISTEADASADKLVTSLRAAFKDKNTKGIIIRANSPGGSPVQAGYVNDEIKRLRKKYPEIVVYAVVTDICASGCYYIVAAVDKIYADKASLVGSIGVIASNGFGFVNAMEKLGIERRLYKAGDSKAFLDPFSPEKPEDVAHIEKILSNIHEQFITTVKLGRGDRLKFAENPQIFSGLIWTGEQAIELGLIDDFGSSSYVAREIIKAEKIKNFTTKPNYLDRFTERLGSAMASALAQRFSDTALQFTPAK
ncbi:MAG: S49 family peptidase [Beggiatoa sp. IS2]|nr:MAG: S49 family peptidase [Beggiatoa sp. IS2]